MSHFVIKLTTFQSKLYKSICPLYAGLTLSRNSAQIKITNMYKKTKQNQKCDIKWKEVEIKTNRLQEEKFCAKELMTVVIFIFLRLILRYFCILICAKFLLNVKSMLQRTSWTWHWRSELQLSKLVCFNFHFFELNNKLFFICDRNLRKILVQYSTNFLIMAPTNRARYSFILLYAKLS